MSEDKAAKITISLPQRLLDSVDHLARARITSRSGLIRQLLEKEEADQLHDQMAEGYQAMADENLREAEEAINLTSQVTLHDGIAP